MYVALETLVALKNSATNLARSDAPSGTGRTVPDPTFLRTALGLGLQRQLAQAGAHDIAYTALHPPGSVSLVGQNATWCSTLGWRWEDGEASIA